MKKLLALLLTLCLVIGMVPLAASAEGEEGEDLSSQISSADDGATITLTENTTMSQFPNLSGNKSLTIDLNGKTLTITQTGSTTLSNGYDLTIKNGGIVAKSVSLGTTALYNIQTKSSITLDDVDLDTTGAALYPQGDAAKVVVQNGSNIKGGSFAVATNAGTAENYGVQIILTDSEFSCPYGYNQDSENDNDKVDNCPVMINVSGTLTMDSCKVTGDRMGVLVRAGDATITNCEITFTGKYSDGNDYESSETWGSGNEVPMAALIVGSQTSAYAADANCEISGTTITVPEGVDKPAIYVSSNKEEQTGNYKSQVTVTGEGTVITGDIVVADGKDNVSSSVTISDNAKVDGNVTNNSKSSAVAIINGATVTGETTVAKGSNGSIYDENKTEENTNVYVLNVTTSKTYKDLAEALKEAQTGDTIRLEKDITALDTVTPEDNRDAVFTILAGVTLDGNGKKITAQETWNKKHPIIGVTTGAADDTTTIKNLTIDGNKVSGHGINVWSGATETQANVEVENVTIKNTLTAGMVVNNSTVTASGLKTEGNAWGAVNVDKRASFKLTGTDNELKENVQVYSEDAGKENGSTITANGLTKVNSNEGDTTLKGYTYYTDDVSKLGEAYNTTTTTVYEDADDAINEAKANETVQIVKNASLEIGGATVADGVTLQVPADVTLTGKLTNKGTVDLDGTIDGNVINEGTIDYDGKITGSLTNQNGGKVEYPYVPPVIPTYKTTVEECEGGSVVASPSSAREGQKVTLTVKPQAGQELKSLKVTDKDGDAVTLTKVEGGYTFNMPKGGVTVTAVFGCDGGAACPSKGFTDLDSEKWYHEYMDYAVEKGLLEGTSPTTMEPNATLTRAQLAQILYNLEGKPAVTGDLPFEDVPEGQWYYAAILWANQEGVVDGMSPDTFAPNEDISRQDLALMLYRYAGEPTVTGDLDGFQDAGQVGDWAQEAITWAVEEGIIDGMTPTTLEPTGTATRAQAAAMLQRFLEG